MPPSFTTVSVCPGDGLHVAGVELVVRHHDGPGSDGREPRRRNPPSEHRQARERHARRGEGLGAPL